MSDKGTSHVPMKPDHRMLGKFRFIGGETKEVHDIGTALSAVAVGESGRPGGFSLYTDATHQFVAYYDSDRRLHLAGRGLSDIWSHTTLPEKLEWDSHNTISMAVDIDGYIHVAGNMHACELKYFRSTIPYDVSSVSRVPTMIGTRETQVTYPRFLLSDDGSLIFCYRDGASGAGSQVFNIYSHETRTWNRLHDSSFIEGEGLRSAYVTEPIKGPDGYFHVCWVWRDTPDAETSHSLGYARSRDLRAWENSLGERLTLPLIFERSEIVDPVPPGGGLINNNSQIGFDTQGRVVITYHKYDEYGHTQLYQARRESNGWTVYQTTQWKHRWGIQGRGSIPFEVLFGPITTDDAGRLIQWYEHSQYGAGTYILEENTLQPFGHASGRPDIPASLASPRSSFPGMRVNWCEDSGPKKKSHDRFVLRWESLSENSDKPRSGNLPDPSHLQLYKVERSKLEELADESARFKTQSALRDPENEPSLAEGQIKNLEARLGAHVAIVEGLVEKYRRQNSLTKGLGIKLRERESEIDALKSELGKQTIEFTAKLTERESEIDALKSGLGKQTNELTAKLTERESEIDALKSGLGKQTNEFTAKLTERESEIDALKSGLGKQTNEFTAKLTKRESEIDALKSELGKQAEEFIAKLTKRESDISSLNSQLGALNARLVNQELVTRNLRSSTSWRITAPMRSVSRAVQFSLRNGRRFHILMRLLFAGQFETAGAALLPYYRRLTPARVRGLVPFRIKDGILRRIGRKREASINSLQHGLNRGKSQENSARDISLPKAISKSRDISPVHRDLTVAIIAWDVCHNAVGRAYLIAEALSGYFNVVILGPAFPRFGGRVWEPLENSSIPIIPVPGSDFPEFAATAEKLAKRLRAHAIIACKPRLPSLLIGHLLKHEKQRPLFVDIDDHELAFTKSDTPLELERVVQRDSEDLRSPFGDAWTRFGESLLDGTDGIFVSNDELKLRFGGVTVPHARDENSFDPNRYDRPKIRSALGFSPDDRVVIFAGTPREHKGVLQVLEAVLSIDDPRAKMLIVGQADRTLERKMRQKGGGRLVYLGNRPFDELPRYLACADAVCLMQDPASRISRYQLPAKAIDALAFGLPVLATSTPPLRPLIEAGVVAETSPETLRHDLGQVLFGKGANDADRNKRRDYFEQHLSYAAIGQTMVANILDALERPVEPNPMALQVQSIGASIPKGAVQPVAQAISLPAGLDIVLVWKQHDMFLYGRRPEMLVKALAARPDVRRVLVLEPPVSSQQLRSWSREAVNHQGRALYVEWLRKSWGVHDTAKVQTHNFTYSDAKSKAKASSLWPTSDNYMNSVSEFFKINSVDPSKATFIVCPKNQYLPEIIDRFRPQRIVADVVDDHRAWPNLSASAKIELSNHYRDVLAQSEFVITNCEPVKEAMAEFHNDIRVLPNGVDVHFDEKYPVSSRFEQFTALPGPIIGFVGNLEAKIDIDLLRNIATQRPKWQLVLIGSAHINPSILQLAELPNVHFPGVVQYEEAKHWIRKFDVAIIPHRRIELTRYMNPLKLYVYLGLGVPVVSTPVENLGGELGQHITVADTPDDFIRAIENELQQPRPRTDEILSKKIASNTWEQRADTLMSWLAPAAKAAEQGKRFLRTPSYAGVCSVCGEHGTFIGEDRPMRETYTCATCRGSIRYREQARAILRYYAADGTRSLSELVQSKEFQSLSIYEPGISGPFRKFLSRLPHYRQSFFWEDVELGSRKDGIECQDLMQLTHADNSFDLVITSDIFEHIRKPELAFREIRRVLKPGGRHIFSVPVTLPMRTRTVSRVDTSTDKDIYLVEPHYHGDGKGGRSLVYTDFGADLLDRLAELAFPTEALRGEYNHEDLATILTFISQKPA